jgi:hypothetical protein
LLDYFSISFRSVLFQSVKNFMIKLIMCYCSLDYDDTIYTSMYRPSISITT